ncbi:hypothetical protein Tco_1174010 [Tanacetum coccineum]
MSLTTKSILIVLHEGSVVNESSSGAGLIDKVLCQEVSFYTSSPTYLVEGDIKWDLGHVSRTVGTFAGYGAGDLNGDRDVGDRSWGHSGWGKSGDKEVWASETLGNFSWDWDPCAGLRWAWGMGRVLEWGVCGGRSSSEVDEVQMAGANAMERGATGCRRGAGPLGVSSERWGEYAHCETRVVVRVTGVRHALGVGCSLSLDTFVVLMDIPLGKLGVSPPRNGFVGSAAVILLEDFGSGTFDKSCDSCDGQRGERVVVYTGGVQVGRG